MGDLSRLAMRTHCLNGDSVRACGVSLLRPAFTGFCVLQSLTYAPKVVLGSYPALIETMAKSESERNSLCYVETIAV